MNYWIVIKMIIKEVTGREAFQYRTEESTLSLDNEFFTPQVITQLKGTCDAVVSGINKNMLREGGSLPRSERGLLSDTRK